MPLVDHPGSPLKPAAYSQHPRPAYYDREPSKIPSVMGVSVRTAKVRYTEWRDTATGQPTSRELYATESDPGETRSRMEDPALAAERDEAEGPLRKQFTFFPLER